MAWTTPRTWVAGELVTAALMNTHVKDNLDYLYTYAAATVQVFDRDTSVYDVVSTSTETTVYSKSIVGGTLGTDGGLRLTMVGDYLYNNGGSDTVTIKVKYGSTTVFSMAVNTSTGANRGGQFLECFIMAGAATNAQRVYTRWIHSGSTQNNNAGAGASAAGTYVAAHNACAEDSTTSLNLVITAQPANGSANHSFRCQSVLLELAPHS